jgi:hypothetical protein
MTTSITKFYHYAECGVLFAAMLNVIMLNVIMLNVIMLNVIMLNVIMLNVIMLNAVMPSVLALSLHQCYLNFEDFESVSYSRMIVR